MTVQEEKQIKEYAEMYARNLVLYGVDVRDKLESATSISASLNQAYMKGRSDECKRFESAMAELQTYQSLGTVEELKEAREKQVAKKPIDNGMRSGIFATHKYYTCPRCGNVCLQKMANERQNTNYCWDCGQALKWGEEE